MNTKPFTTLKTSGDSAIASLMQQRESYPQSVDYPFLIGEADDVERLQEAAEYNEQTVDEILHEAAQFDVAAWLHERRAEAEEYEFSEDDTLGDWPGEIAEKGAISLHRDVLTSEVRPEVYLGSATIA